MEATLLNVFNKRMLDEVSICFILTHINSPELQTLRLQGYKYGGIPVDLCHTGSVEEDGEAGGRADRPGIGIRGGTLKAEGLFTQGASHPKGC